MADGKIDRKTKRGGWDGVLSIEMVLAWRMRSGEWKLRQARMLALAKRLQQAKQIIYSLTPFPISIIQRDDLNVRYRPV